MGIVISKHKMLAETAIYPGYDEYDYLWIDPDGFLMENAGECFICQRYTTRLDINYQGYFCNSYACNLTIEMDLDGTKVE